MLILFSILGTFLFTFFSLPTLYQFQIKEYYLPRIRSGLREQRGFWIPFRMPAKSLRNLLITIFTLTALLVYFVLISSQYDTIVLGYAFYWGLGFLLSKLLVFIGVLLTEPLALIRRAKLIKQAEILSRKNSAKIIGITGSYGKSSMKVILHRLLSEKYKVASTKKNYNSEVGVALSYIEEIKDDTQYFISEMAAYTVGTIRRSTQITPPTIGFVTGLGNQHIDIFGSEENLLKAKSELPEALPDNGVLYVNMDCFNYERMVRSARCVVVKYSISDPKADAYSQPKGGGSFHFAYKNINLMLNTALPGKHSILNLTGAIACAIDLGLGEKDIINALKHIKPISQKLSKRALNNGAVLIDDSYNSSLVGFIAGLHYLSEFPQKEKIVFTRGLIELGDKLASSYERIGMELENLSISLVTTDPQLHRILAKGTSELLPEAGMFEKIRNARSDTIFLLEGRFSPDLMKELKGICQKED